MVFGANASLFGAFVDEPLSARSRDDFVREVVSGRLKHNLTSKMSWSRVVLQNGALWEATVADPSLAVPVRARSIPLCGGAASFEVVAIGADTGAAALLDRWLAQLVPPAVASPICSEQ
jgi:hypothetical protein